MSTTTATSPSPALCLIEDDPDIARIVLRVLADFGYPCTWFHEGQALLDHLLEHQPDLCILDLGLPDMDGMELIARLRQRHPQQCGVLVLTGRSYVADRVMGLELGADDYIVKPFEPRELIARIRSILRRLEQRAAASSPAAAPGGTTPGSRQRGIAHGVAHGVAHFAGWTFNPRANLLTAPETAAGAAPESSLSTSEALLLLHFLESPNRILTREQLLGERDISPFDRSIDVRVSRLRRKLETDPHNPKIIKTVYGAGYLFSLPVHWSPE